MKKIISLIITAVMLLSAFSITGYAKLSVPFTDISKDAWYYDSLHFCYGRGLVNGMTETTFAPGSTLTRAQFVQLLCENHGGVVDKYADKDTGFEDVRPGHWYNTAVAWAVEKGYVSGVSETSFAPNEPVTREQAARILYLCAKDFVSAYLETDITLRADLNGFSDKDKISDWAYEQISWTVAAGIIQGTSDTTLNPKGHTTRAQACRLMQAFNDHILYGGERNTDGAFKILADHIISKDPDSTSQYSVYELDNEDNINYYVRYDEVEKKICFMYSHGVWYSPLGDDTYGKNYEYSTYLEISGLEESYDLNFNYCEFATYRGGYADYVLAPDGYTLAEHLLEEYTGDAPDEALTEEKMLNTANEDVEKLMSFVNDIITEAGLEPDDIFVLPEIMG